MRRFTKLVAAVLVMPLVTGGVGWGLTLEAVAHGAHHGVLTAEDTHFDIVLRHADHADADRGAAGVYDAATCGEDGDGHPGHHPDHVIHLTTADRLAAGAAKRLHATIAGTASTLAGLVTGPQPAGPGPAAWSTHRPPPPAPTRSSILRI